MFLKKRRRVAPAGDGSDADINRKSATSAVRDLLRRDRRQRVGGTAAKSLARAVNWSYGGSGHCFGRPAVEGFFASRVFLGDVRSPDWSVFWKSPACVG